MRSGLLALIVAACAPAPFVAVVEPVVQDEPVAPGIVIPIHAETEYAALDSHDPRLDRACDELAYASLEAAHIAEALAVGWSLDDLHVLGEVAVERRVELAGLDLTKLLAKHMIHTIGVGIAQSARNGPLAGTIWLVVLFY